MSTRSIKAFEDALPDRWVFRDFSGDDDYGIDGEVEIFDDQGRTTGLTFAVQIKARSNKKLNKALSIRFDHDHATYYRDYSLPVLVVVYHVPTGDVFTRWFHHFDPHDEKVNARSITFNLREGDKWSHEKPRQLEAIVRARRRWKSSKIDFPIVFSLEATSSRLHGIPAGQVALALRTLARKVPGLLAIAPSTETRTGPTIRLEPDKIRIDFEGAVSATMHQSISTYTVEEARAHYPADVITAVAIAFMHLGQANAAARLAAAFAADGRALVDPDIAFRVVGMFVQAHRIVDSLRLAERFEGRGDDEGSLISTVLLTAVAATGDELPEEEKEAVMEHYRKRIERAEKAGHWWDASTAHATLASWLQGNHDWEGAFLHLWEAARWDQDYLQKDFFCRNLGGTLFELGQFEHSADFYKRARALGLEQDIRAQHGDALLFSGRYREGRQLIDEYLKDNNPDALAEWRLKCWAVENADRAIGMPDQDRQIDEALKLAISVDGLEDHEVADRAMEALDLDRLCGEAWLNLGIYHRRAHNDDFYQVLCFVMAALILRDLESWNKAAVSAFQFALEDEKKILLFTSIVAAGYRHQGQAFVDALAADVDSVEGFPVDEFMTALDDVIGSIPEGEPSFEIRFLGRGSDYESFRITRPRPE